MKWILLIMLSLSALQTFASTSADFETYTKSAEQGDAMAQYNLGIMYVKGQGVTQDYKQAFNWYSKAAEQGHTKAQYNLGLMYNDGQGVTQNNRKSYIWLAIAAKNGVTNAIKARDLVAKELSPTALESAQEEVRQLSDKIQ